MRGRYGDLLIGLFVIAVAALFLMPLPTVVLDLLLVFNLGFSVLLLLTVLFVAEPSKLFVFPAVLLVSTLFRLGLNVASTRLILLDGYAGEVIQSFGQFLVRGEVIVGIVLFSIITIVNYIVVAKGASRVAEVAARFTLDGLPVKQMTIESDMKAGLLTNQEALKKREELRRESQLYGSMDGAMKFVQGDVVAGIVIIFTNILGGLYLGIQAGLSFGEAAQTYTILTVGDGLVSQIPSLLGAFCAGVVVTRVSSGTGQTLSGEIFEQIFRGKEAWLISGLIMVLLSLAPGIPMVPFALAGGLFLVFAYVLPQRYARAVAGTSAGEFSSDGQNLPRLTQSSIKQLESRKGLSLELDERVFGFAAAESSKGRQGVWNALQSITFAERGVSLPEISFGGFKNAPLGGFRLLYEGTEVFAGKVPADATLVTLHPEAAKLFGLSVIEEVLEPLTGCVASWVRMDRTASLTLQAGEILPLNQLDFVLRGCAGYLFRNPEKLISVADCFSMVKSLSSQDPGLTGYIVDSGLVSVPRLAQILQELVREGIYVGNLRSILEDLAGYFTKFDQPAEGSFTVEELIAGIRARRHRELVAAATSSRGGFRAFTLGVQLRAEVEQAVTRGDKDIFIKNRELVSRALKSFEDLNNAVRRQGIFPVGVFCSSEEREVVAALLKFKLSRVPLISSSEIDSEVMVEEVGVWEI